MKSTRRKLLKLAGMVAVAGVSLPAIRSALPAKAEALEPAQPDPVGSEAPTDLEPMLYFSPEDGAEMMASAMRMGSAVRVVEKDSLIRITTDETALALLPKSEARMLSQLVLDLTEARVGVAIVADEKMLHVGNPLAVPSENHTNNSSYVDAYGAHIYIDPYWTALLRNNMNAAISVIAALVGAMVALIVRKPVGDVIRRVIEWLGGLVWSLLRPHMPTAVTLHIPPAAAFAILIPGVQPVVIYVQLWKSGAWYNGRTFALAVGA